MIVPECAAQSRLVLQLIALSRPGNAKMPRLSHKVQLTHAPGISAVLFTTSDCMLACANHNLQLQSLCNRSDGIFCVCSFLVSAG